MTPAPGYRHGRCDATGKAQYTTRRIAKRVAKQFNDDAKPFRCEHCGYLHLGHLDGLTRAEHREYHAARREAVGADLRAGETFTHPTTPGSHESRSDLNGSGLERAS
ncbi:hypothetical protein [Arthrobacter sp. USHLN218]|uniref:hypothetical protein n=1 Tax=Arthrobacter sp. USHLN218 TaxID=3081232 RepID=UPI003016A319